MTRFQAPLDFESTSARADDKVGAAAGCAMRRPNAARRRDIRPMSNLKPRSGSPRLVAGRQSAAP